MGLRVHRSPHCPEPTPTHLLLPNDECHRSKGVRTIPGLVRVACSLRSSNRRNLRPHDRQRLIHCSTIRVRQSVWDRSIQSPKTPSAIRDVDLSSDISAMLKELIGRRREGFVFENKQGKALAPSNVLRRSLHPLLTSIGVAKAGFHSFRRFRATHLSKSRTPESLMKFWMGHAATSQTEEYVKLFAEVDYRKDVATAVGHGFDLLPAKANCPYCP